MKTFGVSILGGFAGYDLADQPGHCHPLAAVRVGGKLVLLAVPGSSPEYRDGGEGVSVVGRLDLTEGSKTMRALCIRQLHAEAIMRGVKKIEYRIPTCTKTGSDDVEAEGRAADYKSSEVGNGNLLGNLGVRYGQG